jgi:HD-GYP domain-containing protein (c-di-GMP phosphodiesterase class II)
MDETVLKIAIAAFMHDIGKFMKWKESFIRKG